MTTDPHEEGTIWEALNLWGQTLPDWQRFIVSYAVRDGALSAERIEEAYRLFLRDAGLDLGTEELPTIPASVTGRTDQPSEGPLALVALKNLKHVNAIPEDSELTFGPGLTIVYGHNGAGKSGFARVLSAACFSRSKQRIFPNVYEQNEAEGEASAEVVIRLGNEADKTVEFVQGVENDTLLRASVFDSSIARVHLSEETPLGFKPAGFDVFDEVANVIGAISQRLDTDCTSREKENRFVRIFVGESDIATEIENLSKDTNVEALKTLAVFGEAETKRLKEVDRQLAELRAASPEEILKSLAAAKKDIETSRQKANAIYTEINDNACDRYREQLEDLKLKTAAAVLVDPKTVSDSTLTQTGSAQWVEFIEKARVLGNAEKEGFPEEGDPCLLCHRPLDEPSTSLIRRFWGFLDDETRAAAEKANGLVTATVEKLTKMETCILTEESRIRADLSKTAVAVVSIFDGLSGAFESRNNAIVSALESGTAISTEALEVPNEEIDAVVIGIEDREKGLQEGAVDQAIAGLQAEHISLRHRQVLNQNIDDVVNFVLDQKWIDKARQKKRGSLTTRFVTDKQKELFGTLIEGRYKSRLKDECKTFQCALPVEFKARGSGGQTLRGLKIEGGHKPTDILSEGEQRAVALADFLTEVNLNPASAGIVLDDPVTSMDHQRKRLIASRLVEEAKARQVIIFTHDLVFMTFLTDTAEPDSVEMTTHWVARSYDGMPGIVALDECPANSKAYRTTHRAKELLAKAKKSHGQEQVDKVRAGAAALRNTLEEIVIRELFKGTVQRWDEQIRLGSVTSIVWSDDIADEISALQDDISRLIEAHSTSDEFAGGMPEPGELENLIARVDAVRDHARKNRSNWPRRKT